MNQVLVRSGPLLAVLAGVVRDKPVLSLLAQEIARDH